jgi:hypothetical protein
MELHHRVEVIDTLIEETDQKTQALHHAMHAKERAEQTQGSSHGAPLTEEEQACNTNKPCGRRRSWASQSSARCSKSLSNWNERAASASKEHTHGTT